VAISAMAQPAEEELAVVTAYRAAFGRPKAAIGPQGESLGPGPAVDTAEPQRPQRVLDPAPDRRRVPRTSGGLVADR